MYEPHAGRLASLQALALAVAVLAGVAAQAASDCFEPLRAAPGGGRGRTMRLLRDLLFSALLAGPHVAAAEMMTVHFTGTLTAVNPTLSPPFSVGDEVSGSFRFDSEAADENPNPNLGSYPGPTSFTFSFGTYTATAPGGPEDPSAFLFVTKGDGVDDFEARTQAVSGPPIGLFAPHGLHLSLEDFDGTELPSDALPAGFDVAEFENALAGLYFSNGTGLENVSATLTSVDVSVPEPGAPALLAAGAVVLVAIRGGDASAGWSRSGFGRTWAVAGLGGLAGLPAARGRWPGASPDARGAPRPAG